MVAAYPVEAYAVDVVNIGTYGTIEQIVQSRIDPGLTSMIGSANGDVLPTYGGAMRLQPSIGFTTTDITGAITLATNSGTVIPAGAGNDQPVTVYVSKRDQAGRVAGAVHTSLTINDGVFLLRRIIAADGEPAVAELELIVTHDGSANDPIIVAANAALPASTAVAAYYVIGSSWLDAGTLDLISRLTIDMGYQIRRLPGASSLGDRAAFTVNRRPFVELVTPQGRVMSDFSLKGANISGTTKFHLHKTLAGGTLVPKATTEHVRATVYAGQIAVRQTTLSDGQLGAFNVRVDGLDDGANGALVLATGLAIA